MNIMLWVLQGLLALAFLAHGWILLFPSPEMLAGMSSLPRPFWIFLGVAEVLAAVGLSLPGITRILPWLVPCAAAGVMVVMISATIFHVARSEVSGAVVTAILFIMASFVAYMRWKVRPILPRPVA